MLLEIQDLYGGYGGRDVVRGVSCQADAGDILCLLGPNGCGKTTLFRLVLGALPIRRGSVRIDGREVSSLPPRALANLAAYIPQSHRPVFAYTVLEVVTMGRASHFSAFEAPGTVDRDAAFAALEKLHAAHLPTAITPPSAAGSGSWSSLPGPSARMPGCSSWTSPPPAWITPTTSC